MSTSKKILFSALVFLLVATFAESAAYLAGRLLHWTGIFYLQADPDDEAIEDYLAKRDPLLGWPSPSQFGSERYDRTGSRPIPAFPEPGRACVSTYGDSFTYGAGVSDEAAWSNRLSQLLGCRVANYGVGGYGSDQATLRFEQNRDDEAPVVILGHLSENILRNVNRYRRLIATGDAWGFKPRFELDGEGALRLVPPERPESPGEFREITAHPEAHLDGDYFVPGGPSGVQRLDFPYTLRMLRALRHFHVQAELQGLPAYTEFYRRDHPTHGLELTTRILERFADVARERGKLPMLQIIPTGTDLVVFRETGEWTYAPLVARAEELGIDVIDLGPRLNAVAGEGDPCRFFLRCNNHFNELGNEAVARQVAIALDERRIRHLAASQGRWPYPILEVDPLPAVAAAAPEDR